MIMQNIHINVQYASHYILLKDEQSTIYQRKVTVPVQCLLKLLIKMPVVPTIFFYTMHLKFKIEFEHLRKDPIIQPIYIAG